jgi:hypothetical protein
MRLALEKPRVPLQQVANSSSDTKQYRPEHSKFASVPSDDLILHGREFDEWARLNSAAAAAWMESPAGKKHHNTRNLK